MVGSRTTAGSESEMPEGKGEKGTAGKNGSPGDDGASFVVVDGPTLVSVICTRQDSDTSALDYNSNPGIYLKWWARR